MNVIAAGRTITIIAISAAGAIIGAALGTLAALAYAARYEYEWSRPDCLAVLWW